jgi:hypothetical protein
VKGYYDKRYQLYADHKLASILAAAERGDSVSGSNGLQPAELDMYHSDVMQLACVFGHTVGADVPVEPVGEALTIAIQLHAKYTP